MENTGKKRNKLKIIFLAVSALVLVMLLAFFAYTGVYYHAGSQGLAVVQALGVTVQQGAGYTALLPPGVPQALGYIFYPGAKVQESAYLPYLAQVAQQGYVCAVVHAPFRLAVLAPSAANKVKLAFPNIGSWLIGGHSLGGVMAAQYAGGHAAAGLVLLAAYPSGSLAHSRLPVLCITASNDKVLNWQNYENALEKLPPGTSFLSIQGGNHAQFGDYGPQKGDGRADISPQQQRHQVAQATINFLRAVLLAGETSAA